MRRISKNHLVNNLVEAFLRANPGEVVHAASHSHLNVCIVVEYCAVLSVGSLISYMYMYI